MNTPQLEIRPSPLKDPYAGGLCGKDDCRKPATHVLVLVNIKGAVRKDVRTGRRCEACARDNARRFGITFPESVAA